MINCCFCVNNYIYCFICNAYCSLNLLFYIFEIVFEFEFICDCKYVCDCDCGILICGCGCKVDDDAKFCKLKLNTR